MVLWLEPGMGEVNRGDAALFCVRLARIESTTLIVPSRMTANYTAQNQVLMHFETIDATGLSRGESRWQLRQRGMRFSGCHGLVPLEVHLRLGFRNEKAPS
jgi:hypothetical protein